MNSYVIIHIFILIMRLIYMCYLNEFLEMFKSKYKWNKNNTKHMEFISLKTRDLLEEK